MNDQDLHQLLARYPPLIQPLSPLESLRGGGGLSGARLWRFRAEQGELVLRAWPPHGPGRKHIEQVHRWLFLTANLAFVPVPIRDRSGASVQELRGTLWEVAPWLAGSPDRSCPPLADHLRLAFAALAAFHQRLAPERVDCLSAGLGLRHQHVRQLVDGGFTLLETAVDRQNVPDLSLREAAIAWLSLARKVAPRLLKPLGQASRQLVLVQPIIRDARPEHFLFDGDRLSGLVDFGAMGVDSVASDLARLIGEWLAGDPDARREALASYERIRPLDPAEIGLIADFEAGTALLIGERWLRWHYLENRRFDDPSAVSSGLERGLKQLNRLVRQQDQLGHTF
jgi:Ser/Thr protein kinase RdoA (MazF antagonist)